MLLEIHVLTCNFGIIEVSVTLANSTKVVLYDSQKVSVPKAACNVNEYYSTYSLTIPIETAKKHLCGSVIVVEIFDNVTLRTNSIEIVTSKLDKKRKTNYIKKGST